MEIIAEYIDRTVNLEMKMQGLLRGTTHMRYEVARQKQGKPLTYLAAKLILDSVSSDDYVIVVTGSGNPLWLPKGETDGPPGAACLCRALDLGLKAKCVLVSDERLLAPIVKSCEAAGFSVLDKSMVDRREHAAVVRATPIGEDGIPVILGLIDEFSPKCVIFVERSSPNRMGVYHSSLGTGKPLDSLARLYMLADEAKKRGIPTIGIGDGANEVGFGLIHDELKPLQPFGEKCQCSCGGGLVAATATDVLVTAAVSNWGAYGVAACLAFMLENETLIHDAAMEKRMLEACVDAGAGDGHYRLRIPMVDGVALDGDQAIVTILRTMVNIALKKIERKDNV